MPHTNMQISRGTLVVTAKMCLKPRYFVSEWKDWLRHTMGYNWAQRRTSWPGVVVHTLIPALGRLMQGCWEFKTSPGHRATSKPTYAIIFNPPQKSKQELKKKKNIEETKNSTKGKKAIWKGHLPDSKSKTMKTATRPAVLKESNGSVKLLCDTVMVHPHH